MNIPVPVLGYFSRSKSSEGNPDCIKYNVFDQVGVNIIAKMSAYAYRRTVGVQNNMFVSSLVPPYVQPLLGISRDHLSNNTECITSFPIWSPFV